MLAVSHGGRQDDAKPSQEPRIDVNGARIAAAPDAAPLAKMPPPEASLSGTAPPGMGSGPLRPRWRRVLGWAFSAACVLGVALFGAGLVQFADSLPRPRPSSIAADAVVV